MLADEQYIVYVTNVTLLFLLVGGCYDIEETAEKVGMKQWLQYVSA